MWAQPYSDNHDIDKLKSTLYEVVFAKVLALMAEWL